MRLLLPIFIILPALEIAVFLLSGKTIGIGNTFIIMILTGFLGAYLTKKEGLDVFRKVQLQLQSGIPPGNVLLDGICIFLGGCLLISPGFISDCLGIIFLFPPTRKLIKPFLLKWFKRWINQNTIFIIK